MIIVRPVNVFLMNMENFDVVIFSIPLGCKKDNGLNMTVSDEIRLDVLLDSDLIRRYFRGYSGDTV